MKGDRIFIEALGSVCDRMYRSDLFSGSTER